MKRKIILSLICGMLLISITTGCEKTNSNINKENNEINNVPNNSESTNYKELLQSYFKIPMKEIYINYPFYREKENSTWHEVEWGYTEYWHIAHDMFITFSYAKNETANNLSEAHTLATAKMIQNMDNKHLNYITVKSDETLTINGIEMYKFVGTINIGTDTIRDKFIIGYSFIIDGLPCNISGFAYNAEETDEVINEITNTVNAMAQTVRTQK